MYAVVLFDSVPDNGRYQTLTELPTETPLLTSGHAQAFNLVQHVTGPTHNTGPAWTLAFSLSLSINSLAMSDLLSNHK